MLPPPRIWDGAVNVVARPKALGIFQGIGVREINKCLRWRRRPWRLLPPSFTPFARGRREPVSAAGCRQRLPPLLFAAAADRPRSRAPRRCHLPLPLPLPETYQASTVNGGCPLTSIGFHKLPSPSISVTFDRPSMRFHFHDLRSPSMTATI